MVVGGGRQETLDPRFVLLGTRHQSVPVILRELVLPGGFDLVSPSFTFRDSVCNTNVHVIATNIKSCNSDSTESSIYNDDLSLSTIAIDSVESQSSSELNQIRNSCETTFSQQSIYHNSHVIVPGMAFPNDSHISDEISYKSE
ncbi:unnamed protein product [Schistosoma margrebowiei]|uniref:Uncharacterized protein n=1 Tax=Schistosoma margrebowiei TaxID=48269 RepID=A0A183LJE8_9TREM|nr:unnamed protein product [Schistosoma margrebowiei]